MRSGEVIGALTTAAGGLTNNVDSLTDLTLSTYTINNTEESPKKESDGIIVTASGTWAEENQLLAANRGDIVKSGNDLFIEITFFI